MMFRALALALLVTAAPAFAGPNDAAPPAPTPATAAEPAAPAKADPNEKVCKLERQLGSNKMKRVCRTRAQMEIDREAAREALSREQRR